MKTIKDNTLRTLRENYKESGEKISFNEWVNRESENDPNFFRFLFNKEFDNDFDADLSDEERKEFKETFPLLVG
jgi:hypothetical protein